MRMMKSLIRALGFAVVMVAGDVYAALIISAVDDFSLTTKTESSTWSYRFSNDLAGNGSYQFPTGFSELESIWNKPTQYWNDGRSILVDGAVVGDNNSVPFSALGLAAKFVPEDVHAALIFSAMDDFSLTTNTESSTWSYRFSDDLARDGSYQLQASFSQFESLWNPATQYWNDGRSIFGDGAVVGVNNSGISITWIGNAATFLWPNNTIWMHLGSGLVVMSWLSPLNTFVDIDFTFGDMDPNGMGQGGTGFAWFVDLNDSSGLLASGVITEGGGDTGPLSLTGVAVNAGDHINFVVDPNGNRAFDSTSFTATIAVIPEPATVRLFVVGLLGLLGFWKFQRGKKREV